MNIFIYKLTPRTKSGYVNAVIYYINSVREPVFVGDTRWNTASFKGNIPEIKDFLASEGYVRDEIKLFEV